MRATLVAGALATAAVVAPIPGFAEVTVNVNIGAPPPPPIVVLAPPRLVLVPGVPAVHYAPALHVDLFFHDNRWYYPHGGFWYVGRSYKGPWTAIPIGHVPGAVLAVPVQYYKIPPGHLKNHGKGGPPGRAKGKHKD